MEYRGEMVQVEPSGTYPPFRSSPSRLSSLLEASPLSRCPSVAFRILCMLVAMLDPAPMEKNDEGQGTEPLTESPLPPNPSY